MPFENDPNVTDKKFPGNPTRSYRSSEPLRVVGEVTDWTRLTPRRCRPGATGWPRSTPSGAARSSTEPPVVRTGGVGRMAPMTDPRRTTILITGAEQRAGRGDGAAVRRVGPRPGAVRPAYRQARGAPATRSWPTTPARRVEIRALDVTDDEQVFEVFRAFQQPTSAPSTASSINAGLGKGAPLGTGRYDANRETAMTNFVAALAQSEAAMEIFRAQNAGHFVMISSMSAVRGLPRTHDDVRRDQGRRAHLAEGLRAELYGKPIKVTVLYPGYIASEMNEQVDPAKARGMVSTEKGVRSMVAAIEKEVGSACVPALPWAPISVLMKHAPMPVLRRIM